MVLTKKELISLIQEAFKDVELGNGIGLKEGQALDDYESVKVQNQYRESDEKNDWSNIPVNQLNNYHSSLSFFDAEGMRFHLPAFLISELEETLWNGILFHLIYFTEANSELKEYSLMQFQKLNRQQKHAVIQFLEWCLPLEKYDFEHAQIETSLTKFWTQHEPDN